LRIVQLASHTSLSYQYNTSAQSQDSTCYVEDSGTDTTGLGKGGTRLIDYSYRINTIGKSSIGNLKLLSSCVESNGNSLIRCQVKSSRGLNLVKGISTGSKVFKLDYAISIRGKSDINRSCYRSSGSCSLLLVLVGKTLILRRASGYKLIKSLSNIICLVFRNYILAINKNKSFGSSLITGSVLCSLSHSSTGC